jgi:hypothetical protein
VVKTTNKDFAHLIYAKEKDRRAVKRPVSIPKWADGKAARSG